MNEKQDKYIKEKLQNDKIISKQVDEMFNNLLKGEMNMKNEEISKSHTVPKKKNWYKGIVASVATILLVFIVSNVYASINGYDNVFFMIKYLINNKEVVTNNKEEIFADRDITISYEPINISENISITVNKMTIKDNKTKLFILMSLDRKEAASLKYKVYNSSNDTLAEITLLREPSKDIKYIEEIELELSNYKNEEILKLDIEEANLNILTKLEINLKEKTITVLGEKEALEKISEAELKNYVSDIARWIDINNNADDANIEEEKVKWALLIELLEYDLGKDLIGYSFNGVNDVLQSYVGTKISENFKGKDMELYEQDGIKYYIIKNGYDLEYYSKCFDIPAISYANGMYTATATYAFFEDYDDQNISATDIYQTTIKFRLNKDDKYSKFQLVSYESPTIIKPAEKKKIEKDTTENKVNNTVSENTINNNINQNTTENKVNNNISENTINNNISENTINNNVSENTINNNVNNQTTSTEKLEDYVTTISWAEHWAPGLKFLYPSTFEVIKYDVSSGIKGELVTQLNGKIKDVDLATNKDIESNMTIYIYAPEHVSVNTKEKYFEMKIGEKPTGSAYETETGIFWYEHVKKVGAITTKTYTTFFDGWGQKIEIVYNNPIPENVAYESEKLLNTIDWLIFSTKRTSF